MLFTFLLVVHAIIAFLLVTVILLIVATAAAFFMSHGLLSGFGLAEMAGGAVASSPESVAGTFYNRLVGIALIAVAVVVEHGGSGGRAAAPVAREILDYYMKTNH